MMKISKILSLICFFALAMQACKQELVEEFPPDQINKFQANDQLSVEKAGAAVSAYGTFTIQNAAGNKFMEVAGDFAYNEKYNNGSKISQYSATASGNLWQKWQTIYKKSENGRNYYALMNLHSGKFLDVPSGSSTTGLQLQQWEYNGSDSQLFEFREVAGGYAIINKANGLAVSNQNSSTSNGTAIVQETYSGGSSGNGVTVFQNCTWGGYAVVLSPGNYTLSQLQALGVTNDDVSSVSVPGGYEITMYADNNFLGNSLTLTSDDDCLVDNGWNDQLSSLKVTATGGNSGNLALNKAVTVSSTESSSQPGAYAVDGNAGTRWSSQYSDPQWLYVDLGSSYNINHVKITWETALGRDYQIQVSNDASNWNTVKTVTGNTNLVNDLTGLSGSARYVRVYGTARGTSWGYSIFEMEVYGGSGGGGSSAAANQTWVLNLLPAESYRDDVVTRYFQRNDPSLGSVAWDQGSSIPLTSGSNSGKVLWVTQDAWDGSSLQSNGKFPCNYFFSYNNSIIIQQDKNDWAPDDPNMTINSPMGRPKQICSNQPGTNWSWPSNGVEIDNKVYMHCGEGQGLGLTNQSLYILTESAGTLWSVQRTTPAGMSGQTTVNYASGMVKASDGYVYVFGTHGTGYGYTNDIHVARFPVSNPQSWSFWNGSSWTGSPTTGTAARVADAKATAAITYVNGNYVMITMDQGYNCDDTRNIYAAVSSSPTGPFSTPVKVYQINDYFHGSYTRYYTPNVHPEFNNGRNELLITYSVNQSACGVNDCINGYVDPNYYRIRGVRIPYSKMGI